VSKRSKIIPPALKHGGYSGLAVLPGEDKAAFEKLRRDLIAELNPKGPLEEDIVVTLARYVWRKQNLKTYRLAQAAKKRRVELMTTLIEREDIPEEIVARMLKNRTAYPQIPRRSLSEENIAKLKSIVEQLHEQMNDQDFELAEIADDLTTANLQNELALIDRLDAMIDRAIKRLLMVRGIKSLGVSSEAVPSRTPLLVSTSSCA
jgi:hypothetical protein